MTNEDEPETDPSQMINDLFTEAEDLTNDSLRVDSRVKITPDGFPIYELEFSRPISRWVFTRDDLEKTIKGMMRSLREMDNWLEDRR